LGGGNAVSIIFPFNHFLIFGFSHLIIFSFLAFLIYSFNWHLIGMALCRPTLSATHTIAHALEPLWIDLYVEAAAGSNQPPAAGQQERRPSKHD